MTSLRSIGMILSGFVYSSAVYWWGVYNGFEEVPALKDRIEELEESVRVTEGKNLTLQMANEDWATKWGEKKSQLHDCGSKLYVAEEVGQACEYALKAPEDEMALQYLKCFKVAVGVMALADRTAKIGDRAIDAASTGIENMDDHIKKTTEILKDD